MAFREVQNIQLDPVGTAPDFVSTVNGMKPAPRFIEAQNIQLDEPVEEQAPGFISTIMPSSLPEGKQVISQLARPTLEAGFGAGGAIVGTGAGPAGTLAGAGLGFAIGSELADQLDEFLGLRERQPLLVELTESAEDVAIGAAFEAGGQAIPAIAGPVLKFAAKKLPKIPFTKTGAEKKAGEVIAANTTSGPLIAKNIEEAQTLEQAIPGLKFGRGQLTNDPAVIKFERAQARMPGGAAAQQAEQTAANSKAIRDFINTQKGEAGIGEVIDPLARQREVVETGVEAATKGLEREAVELGKGPGAVQTGETIRAAAREGKTVARKEAGRLFEEVPEFDIDARSLINKIDELSQPLNKFENVGANVPEVFGRAREALEVTGKATPQDLQGLRSELAETLRDVTSSATPNNRMASRISGLIDEVDDVLKEAGKDRGIRQATYKGEIIYPEELEKELVKINKKIQTAPPAEKVIDTEKTFKELSDAKTLGIMRQVQEGSETYADRLAKTYKIKFGKDAPTEKAVENIEIKFAKQRKAEIEKILAGSVDIKTTKMEVAAKKLKTAQQFFKKEVVQKFQTASVGDVLKKVRGGDKVSNAQVVSRFFKPGKIGEESAQEFINAVGKNKTATDAMESAVKQDMLQATTNPVTGEISESKLKGWLSKHNLALTKLGIKNKFNTALKVRAELDKAIDIKAGFDKSVATRLLNSDVDTAVKNAFASGSKRRNAIELMGKLKGDKKAIAGLQNATIDHIITQAETTAVDAFDNPIVSLAGVEREFTKFKPAIDVMFRDAPDKLKAFTQYRRALRKLQIGKASPLGGGSDTAENILTSIAKTGGLSSSRTANIIKTVIKPFKEMGDNQVNALLNRAAFDPDFAKTLQMAAMGRPVDVIERRLKGHLAALGMRHFAKKEK